MQIKFVDLTVVDIDEDAIETLKILYDEKSILSNFKLVCFR